MEKVYSVILVGLFVIAIGIASLDNNSDVEFNPCVEQPTFGLQYQNCATIECANFYEDIKNNIHEEYCE